MKNIFTLILILLTSYIYGQIDFLKTGNVFRYRGSGISWNRIAEVTIGNDTMVNGLNYKKVSTYAQGWLCPTPSPCRYTHERSVDFYRQDKGILSRFINGKDHEVFNYNMNLGDTIGYGHVTLTLDNISDTLINNKKLKTWSFNEKCNVNNGTRPSGVNLLFIEGLGSITSGVLGISPFGCATDYYKFQLCGVDSPELKFGSNFCVIVNTKNTISSDFVKLSPNPVSSILEIDAGDVSILGASIYSLDGKLIKKSSISSDKNSIDVSDLLTGMFIIKLTDENQNIISKKFAKI